LCIGVGFDADRRGAPTLKALQRHILRFAHGGPVNDNILRNGVGRNCRSLFRRRDAGSSARKYR
jgi:hypothetical protein